MGFIVKGFLALIWLLAVPTLSGVLFLPRKEAPTTIECLLTGYIFLFSLFELLVLPMIYFKAPLHILVICFGVLTGVAALAGAFRLAKDKKPQMPDILGVLRNSSPFLWAAFFVIAFQLAIVTVFAHFDADDAFFVAAGTTAVQTDTIFEISAYTGLPYKALPYRYILSPFPIFLAVISQLCGGLHPAIMAHTIFPPVFLLCVYCCVYQFARKWFKDDQNAQAIFLFLTAMLCWFSAYSVYNTGNFQMVRLWQGKAVLAALLLPLIFYLSSSIILEEQPQYSWFLLFMANASSCLLSSMGIILAPLMICIFAFLGLLRFHSLKRVLYALFCCVPSIALGMIYLYIRSII